MENTKKTEKIYYVASIYSCLNPRIVHEFKKREHAESYCKILEEENHKEYIVLTTL